MIDLYTPEAMRRMDAKFIGEYGIPGIQLMENAADGVASRVEALLDANGKREVFVLCGPGNNGGDGFAASTCLHQNGRDVYVIVLTDIERYKGDALYEYKRAVDSGCRFLSKEKYLEKLNDRSIVIDALFGTGLSRLIDDETRSLMDKTNESGAYILAVDIPSGLNGRTGEVMGKAFRANETITFQKYKIGLLTENGRMYSGKVTVHPISEVQTEDVPEAFCMEQEDAAKILPERPLDSHKGKNGRALILGGCSKYKGAIKLCTAAALRGGCGLLSVAVPGALAPAFYDLPEAMCIPLPGAHSWDVPNCVEAEKFIIGKNALAVGPGMGPVSDTGLLDTVISSGIPTVIDADGLNHIAVHREFLSKLHKKIVLTPHPAELSRLLECKVDDILRDPPGSAVQAANELNAVVVLKSATSYISDGESLFLNLTGNPGLAKGGSGDTLTGLILAMLSQGLSPMDAACVGTYLLGASADNAVKILGNRMLLAGDVIDMIHETAAGIRLYR